MDLGAGKASLHFTDLPVFDYINFANSFLLGSRIPDTPLPATMTLDIEWSGRKKDLGIYHNEGMGFTDHLVEVDSVTVAASVTEAQSAPGSPYGFTFTTEPTTFKNTFSVIGREGNGRFARNPEYLEGA